MEPLIAVLAVTLLTVAVGLRRPHGSRFRRAVARRWRAQLHLWEVVLSQAGPSPGRGTPDESLRWVGPALEGSVLPDGPR